MTGTTYLYGNSGKDIIRSDWFQQYNDAIVTLGDEYLFGDFKYGGDALDKDLWGDADIIYGGDNDQDDDQYIYGGDGDDTIYQGNSWYYGYIEAGNGNDDIYIGQGFDDDIKVYGGDGDDVWHVRPYGEVDEEDNANDGDEYMFGNKGNDIVRGTHKAGYNYLYGGDGNDKIYGGDYIESSEQLFGMDGDDWLEGGYNS